MSPWNKYPQQNQRETLHQIKTTFDGYLNHFMSPKTLSQFNMSFSFCETFYFRASETQHTHFRPSALPTGLKLWSSNPRSPTKPDGHWIRFLDLAAHGQQPWLEWDPDVNTWLLCSSRQQFFTSSVSTFGSEKLCVFSELRVFDVCLCK